VILLLVIFWARVLLVSAERLPLKVFTSADGLGSSFVDYLMRDSRGFMWFCTRDGLSRFDGSQFVTYRIGNKDAPPGIERITETSGGVYWITTTGGFYRFRADAVSPPIQSSGNSPFLNAEYIDDGRGSVIEDIFGNVWYGGHDLYLAQERNGKAEFQKMNLNLSSRSQQELTIFQMSAAADGCIWLITNFGLVRRLPDGRIILYPHETSMPLSLISMITDIAGRAWAVWGNEIYVIKPAPLEALPVFERITTLSLKQTSTASIGAGSEIHLPAKPGEILLLTDSGDDMLTRRLYQTHDGHIWLTDNNELLEFDGRGFRVYNTAQGLPSGMAEVAEDAAGNLWSGGRTGVARLDRRGLISYSQADGLNSPNLFAINESTDGTLYFANGDFQLSRFDGKRFQTARPHVPRDARALWISRYAFLSSANEWWILTAEGLYRFAAANLQKSLATYDRQSGLKANEAFQIFEDSRGDIWLSQQASRREDFGLYRMRRGETKFYRFSEAEGLPAGMSASSFAEDRHANLWFGFYEGGLVRFANNRFTEFAAKDGLPRGAITDLHVDQKGHLWLTTSNSGVGRIDNPSADKLSVVSLTTDQGLASNSTRTITEDHFGNIYIGTVRGLDRISPDNRIKHYSAGDGLAGDFVVDSHCDKNGVLWFATANGLSRLTPTAEGSQAPPTIWLGGLQIAGERQAVSDLGDAEITKGDLPHARNNLQINFFGLDFRAGEGLRYQYRLEGADTDWSVPSEQRSVTYANLQPGRYRFLVRAVNSEGLVSEKPAVLSFRILSPIWLRWWFVTLALILFGGAVLSLARYRSARRREQQRGQEALQRLREERLAELERVRKRIATDLHDDIGSSLTQISTLSEVARQRVGNAEAAIADPLAMIAVASRELVDSMGDIVWAINPQRDHLSDLIHRMRRFASDTFSARKISFQFQANGAADDMPVGANVRREVFLIFKESVNNMVRHAECTKVEIEISFADDQLILRLQDNGKGFDTSRVSEGHGLVSMRDRARELGGLLMIESESGSGTAVTLRVSIGAEPRSGPPAVAGGSR
jgi:signal transduction histidine kinase/ligand-binding sensor domain-containing protein